MRAVPAALLTAAVTAALAGCGGSPAKETVAVTATDTACQVAKTQLPGAGTYAFKVTNKGSETTEVYVYTSAGDKVEEVEHIGPGTSRTLKADLKSGDYQVACKPGEKGDGIRTDIHVG